VNSSPSADPLDVLEAYRLPALPILAIAYAVGVSAGAILGGAWSLTVALVALLAAASVLRGERRAWLVVAAIALAGARKNHRAGRGATPVYHLARR
jgi:hypothetical protein